MMNPDEGRRNGGRSGRRVRWCAVRRSGARVHAFTLIELLVVLGIIGILISLLMPALTRVRERSMTIHCLNNLRQLGGAVHQYVADHQGRFPTRPLMEDGIQMMHGYQWDSQIGPYLGLQPRVPPTQPTVFACPTSPLIPIWNTPRYRAGMCSYKYNGRFLGSSASDHPFMHAMRNPSRLGVLAEYRFDMTTYLTDRRGAIPDPEWRRWTVFQVWASSQNVTISWSWGWYIWKIFSQTHDGNTPVLFADGHVQLHPTRAGKYSGLEGVAIREPAQ